MWHKYGDVTLQNWGTAGAGRDPERGARRGAPRVSHQTPRASTSGLAIYISNMYIHTYVCIYIYIYTYICTYTYLCIYIHPLLFSRSGLPFSSPLSSSGRFSAPPPLSSPPLSSSVLSSPLLPSSLLECPIRSCARARSGLPSFATNPHIRIKPMVFR